MKNSLLKTWGPGVSAKDKVPPHQHDVSEPVEPNTYTDKDGFQTVGKKNKRFKASFNVYGNKVYTKRDKRLPPHPGRNQAAHVFTSAGSGVDKEQEEASADIEKDNCREHSIHTEDLVHGTTFASEQDQEKGETSEEEESNASGYEAHLDTQNRFDILQDRGILLGEDSYIQMESPIPAYNSSYSEGRARSPTDKYLDLSKESLEGEKATKKWKV